MLHCAVRVLLRFKAQVPHAIATGGLGAEKDKFLIQVFRVFEPKSVKTQILVKWYNQNNSKEYALSFTEQELFDDWL